MRLKDRVAIVTGAAQGIGQAVAMRFAREGAHLMVGDMNGEGVKKVALDVEGLGRKSLWLQVDVSNTSQVEAMVKKTADTFGRVDILVNNAGGSFNLPAKLEEVTDEIWDQVVDVNLKGAFLCARAVAPYMKMQKYGRIINLSSKAGKYGGELTGIQYSSSKAGVLGLTRQLAKDLGPWGITANAVAPGICLSSPRLEKLWMERKTEAERQATLNALPLRRVSTVDEQAAVIFFLASDDASYVTGVNIDVNGGWFMS
ncbi:MAG: SDR family NAD(P)-dependent oxidoreductase [Deltaproteobacteria bacterium]|nr:SDR family NAD(P)-dependent oxidoreductase [Deltaproteobacteria bacterium]